MTKHYLVFEEDIVDNVTSTSTTAPLSARQGKVLNDTLAGKQNLLTFDTVPTSASANPVTSNGIHTAISNIAATVSASGILSFGPLPTYTVTVTHNLPDGSTVSPLTATVSYGDSLNITLTNVQYMSIQININGEYHSYIWPETSDYVFTVSDITANTAVEFTYWGM